MRTGKRRPPSRGSALLMVLWVSAALVAVGFSLASTVRGETERASTALDGLRSYYLAVGGLERGMIELLWSAMYPGQRVIPKGSAFVDYNFPSGAVHVEFIPETAKLDVNHIELPELTRLISALGVPMGNAGELAQAIIDFRRPDGGGQINPYYSTRLPSFRPPHTSFHEIEDLLLVRGMTPELFYGTYVPAESGEPTAEGSGRLAARPGLFDCLTVYGSDGRVDINTASPAVLAAIGVPPFAINTIVERRRKQSFTDATMGEVLGSLGVSGSRLRTEGNYIITLRATARLRTAGGFSDLKRGVAAQVRYLQPDSKTALNILRWYDTAWSN